MERANTCIELSELLLEPRRTHSTTSTCYLSVRCRFAERFRAARNGDECTAVAAGSSSLLSTKLTTSATTTLSSPPTPVPVAAPVLAPASTPAPAPALASASVPAWSLESPVPLVEGGRTMAADVAASFRRFHSSVSFLLPDPANCDRCRWPFPFPFPFPGARTTRVRFMTKRNSARGGWRSLGVASMAARNTLHAHVVNPTVLSSFSPTHRASGHPDGTTTAGMPSNTVTST